MSYPSSLLNQPYSITLLADEAELIHDLSNMALHAPLAANINPVSGLQESLIVPADAVYDVLGELNSLHDILSADADDQSAIALAQDLRRRVKHEILRQRILRLATLQLKDLRAACRWYILTPIPQLESKTASELVDDERVGEVENFLGTHGIERQD